MKFNEDLATIHAYLCADGYVIKNPPTQKHKYYKIGLRNTCRTLLEDFKKRCDNEFCVNAIIYRNERCSFGSKEVYRRLTESFSYYSYEWSLPKLPKNLLSLWLRAFFDCEGWVFVEERQNRQIGADSVNHKGLRHIHEALKMFGISSKLKKRSKRNLSRLMIYGKENIEKFQTHIGFLHPKKNEKLKCAIASYVDYGWQFPEAKIALRTFTMALLKRKAKVKKSGLIGVYSIMKGNLTKLSAALEELFRIESKVYGPWVNGYGTPYYELVVQKKSEIIKTKQFL